MGINNDHIQITDQQREIINYLHPSMYYKIHDSHRKIPLNGEVPMKDNPVLNQ